MQSQNKTSYNEKDGYNIDLQATKNQVQNSSNSPQEPLTKAKAQQPKNRSQIEGDKDNFPVQAEQQQKKFNKNTLKKPIKIVLETPLASNSDNAKLANLNNTKKDSK